MTKILNLDPLTETKRVLRLRGKEYDVPDMSVKIYVETSRKARKLIDEKASIPDQVEATMDMICLCIPELSRAELERYSLTVLTQISDYCRGEGGEEEGATPAAALPTETTDQPQQGAVVEDDPKNA